MKQALFILILLVVYTKSIYSQQPTIEFEYNTLNFNPIKVGESSSSASLFVINGGSGDVSLKITEGFKLMFGQDYLDSMRFEGGSHTSFAANIVVTFKPIEEKTYHGYLIATDTSGLFDTLYLNGTASGSLHIHDNVGIMKTDFLITPNPASTSVTVSIKDAGQIDGATMTDELGKTIFYYNQPQQTEWKWELNPTRIAAGTYFIRISGKTAEGKPFVVSRRLVVE